MEILDGLCAFSFEKGETISQKPVAGEAQSLETDVQATTEKAHEAIKSHAQISAASTKLRQLTKKARSIQVPHYQLLQATTAIKIQSSASGRGRDRSVLSLKDWLKEEVRIRVEAMEMSHGLSGKETTDSSQPQNRCHIRSKARRFHIGAHNSTQKKRRPEWQNQVTRKTPFACCGFPHHGI